MSFKPERAFNVIAAVFGQSEVLYSKWSARVQGDMWVNQRRDPLA